MLQAAVKTWNISMARTKPDHLRESPLGILHPPQSSSDFQALVCMPLIPQHAAGTRGSEDILQYIVVKWQIFTPGHAGCVPLPKRFRRRSQRRKRSWASFTLHSLFSPATPGRSGRLTGRTENIGLKCPNHFCKWALGTGSYVGAEGAAIPTCSQMH